MNEAKKKPVQVQRDWRHGLLFCILFGMLAKAYFSKFDCMLILNTDDNLNTGIEGSALFNTKMVKISMSEGSLFDSGIKMMNTLSDAGLIITYDNRSNDGTFKARFAKAQDE